MLAHDEYDALQRRSGLIDRSARGRILLTGTDRRSYLQGLLTNDIAALGPGQGCYAALLTPQGRMISDMRVSELGDALLVDLPGRTAETVRTRFADFVFAEDVEVRDAGASLAQIGLYGPQAVGALHAIGGEVKDEVEGREARSMPLHANRRWLFLGRPGYLVRSDDYGVAGFELFVEPSVRDELIEACRGAGAVAVSAATLDVTRIEAGRPEFGVDMDEGTIPLEAGIEDRAISPTKGCYVGQEIIIRVLHRGHGRVARRLVGLAADAAAAPMARGERVFRDAKEAGIVTSAAVSPRLGRPIALASVHRDHTEPGTVLDVAADGAPARRVTVVSLPFAAPAG